MDILKVGDRVELVDDWKVDEPYMRAGHKGVIIHVGIGYSILMDEDPERIDWAVTRSDVRKV